MFWAPAPLPDLENLGLCEVAWHDLLGPARSTPSAVEESVLRFLKAVALVLCSVQHSLTHNLRSSLIPCPHQARNHTTVTGVRPQSFRSL